MSLSVCDETPLSLCSFQTPRESRYPVIAQVGYNKHYHQAASTAYNLCTYLTRGIRAPWVLFGTAMALFHRFVASHGVDRVPPLILGAASFFLGSKIEGISRVKLEVILQSTFLCDRNHPDYEKRREQVLQTEIMILHTLKFDIRILHPLRRLDDIFRVVYKDEKSVFETYQLVKVCNKFVAYTFHLPLYKIAGSDEVAEAIVKFVSEALDDHAFDSHIHVSKELYESVTDMLLYFMSLSKKTCGIKKIDDMVGSRNKRGREGASPLPV